MSVVCPIDLCAMEMRLEIVEAYADTIWVLQGSSEWFAQRRADNNDVEAALITEKRGNKR